MGQRIGISALPGITFRRISALPTRHYNTPVSGTNPGGSAQKAAVWRGLPNRVTLLHPGIPFSCCNIYFMKKIMFILKISKRKKWSLLVLVWQRGYVYNMMIISAS